MSRATKPRLSRSASSGPSERNSNRVDENDEEELYEKEREKKERPKAEGRYSADPEVAADQRKKRNQKRNQRRNALKRKLGSD